MSAPLLVVETTNPLPAYEQIGSQIRLQIAAGRLTVGTRLPSVRQLSRDLGVATNTVVRAYTELEAAGWVVTSARRGVSVADRGTEVSEEDRRGEVRQAVTRLLLTVQHLGITVADLHAEIDRQCRVTIAPSDR